MHVVKTALGKTTLGEGLLDVENWWQQMWNNMSLS